MAFRIRQVERVTQPQEAVALATSELLNAIGKPSGVILKPLPWNKTDAGRQYSFPVIGSGASIQSGEGGLALSFDGSNASGAFSYGNAAALACQNATSLIVQVVFSQEALANNQALLGIWGGTGDTEAFILGPAADGSVTWGVYQDGSDVNICYTNPGVITAGKVYSVVCRWTGGIYTLDMWVNGVYTPLPNIAWRVGSPATNLNNSLSASAVVQFGNDSSGTGAFVGKIYDATIATNWTPPDQFLQDWSANPWQLYEPEQIIVKAGAGVSGTTLTPGNLALTLTGYAPTVAQTANVTLTPGVVALTLTGFSPTVTQTAGVTLTPGTAALTLTGYAPTVAQTANVTLTPNVLALTLTGYAPTVGQTTGLNLIPDTVALTATGYAPTVAQTTNVFLTPSTLVLSLVGYAPTVTQTGTIVVTKGGTGRGSNLTLKQKKKLKAVVNQEWLKAEQTAKELLYERLGHAEPAKTKVERLTTVQSLGDVIAALQALSKETVTLPEQQAVIKSFEKSIDTKIVKTGERLVYVEDKVNETLGRIEKKIQNLEDLLIVIIDDLL